MFDTFVHEKSVCGYDFIRAYHKATALMNIAAAIHTPTQKRLHCGNESTTIFCLSYAGNSGKSLIRVLSKDRDLLVLLVCWLSREVMECKVHMERWK